MRHLWIVWMGLCVVLAGRTIALETPLLAKQVVVAPLWGPLTPQVAERTVRLLAEAESRRARVVVLDLDTPGGDAAAALRVVEAIAAHPELYVVAYVSGAYHQGAWNAGALVALSARRICVAPGAAIGAVRTVLLLDGNTRNVMPQSDALFQGRIRALGEQNGHPRAVVEALLNPDAELWLTADEQGTTARLGSDLGSLAPSARAAARKLKEARMPITLSAGDATSAGLAQVCDPGDFPAYLGLPRSEWGPFRFAWKQTQESAVETARSSAQIRDTLRNAVARLASLSRAADMLEKGLGLSPQRRALTEARNAFDDLAKECVFVRKLAAASPALGPSDEEVLPLQQWAESQRADLARRAALLPNVRDTEFGGVANSYGFQPVYTFEAEDHIASDEARRQRDSNAGRGAVVSCSGGRDSERIVLVRPGGMAPGDYVARFVIKVVSGVSLGETLLRVESGAGSGSFTLDRRTVRDSGAVSSYANYDVAFSSANQPIALSIDVRRMGLLVDRIEVWRRNDLFPPVIRQEQITK